MSTIKQAAAGEVKKSFLKKLVAVIAFLGFPFATGHAAGGETSMAEYHVKALFLLNFTKYVAWPEVSFPVAGTPVIIGVCGEDRFGDELRKTIEGKTVSGRQIIIRPIERGGDAGKCHILFISDSEKYRLGEILNKIKAQPVLTVGESDQFLEQGGMINFVKKEDKVRLEINLAAARQARLQISSKLLNVADVVKGK